MRRIRKSQRPTWREKLDRKPFRLPKFDGVRRRLLRRFFSEGAIECLEAAMISYFFSKHYVQPYRHHTRDELQTLACESANFREILNNAHEDVRSRLFPEALNLVFQSLEILEWNIALALQSGELPARRGRPIDLAGAMLAMDVACILNHHGIEPTTTIGGLFVFALETILKTADGRASTHSPHWLARRAVAIIKSKNTPRTALDWWMEQTAPPPNSKFSP